MTEEQETSKTIEDIIEAFEDILRSHSGKLTTAEDLTRLATFFVTKAHGLFSYVAANGKRPDDLEKKKLAEVFVASVHQQVHAMLRPLVGGHDYYDLIENHISNLFVEAMESAKKAEKALN